MPSPPLLVPRSLGPIRFVNLQFETETVPPEALMPRPLKDPDCMLSVNQQSRTVRLPAPALLSSLLAECEKRMRSMANVAPDPTLKFIVR